MDTAGCCSSSFGPGCQSMQVFESSTSSPLLLHAFIHSETSGEVWTTVGNVCINFQGFIFLYVIIAEML